MRRTVARKPGIRASRCHVRCPHTHPPQLISLNLAAKASLADNAFTAACVLGYAEVVTVFCFGLGKTGRILDDIDSLCRHQEMSHVT